MSEVSRCKRCGRTLKNPVYVEAGYGKVCAAKEGIVVQKGDKGAGHGGKVDMLGPCNIGPAIVCWIENGEMVTNIPHRIIRHSPTGFAWGYGGSGPAELALNSLSCVIGQEQAEPLYQKFKAEFIATLPEAGGAISVQAVKEWAREHGARV